MFGEIFGFLKDTIEFIWPFRIVHEWEAAGYYICGHWMWECKPGLKIVVPWFFDVKSITLAPHPVVGDKQDITLADGTLLTFKPSATVRVVDVYAVLNEIEDYHHSSTLLLAGVLAEQLAQCTAADFEMGARPKIMKRLTRALRRAMQPYGVEMTELAFSTFVLNLKTYRLLTDGGSLLA